LAGGIVGVGRILYGRSHLAALGDPLQVSPDLPVLPPRVEHRAEPGRVGQAAQRRLRGADWPGGERGCVRRALASARRPASVMRHRVTVKIPSLVLRLACSTPAAVSRSR
jgi:hypothetical protein